MINFFEFLPRLQTGQSLGTVVQLSPSFFLSLFPPTRGGGNCRGFRIFLQNHESYRKRLTFSSCSWFHTLLLHRWHGQADSVRLQEIPQNILRKPKPVFHRRESSWFSSDTHTVSWILTGPTMVGKCGSLIIYSIVCPPEGTKGLTAQLYNMWFGTSWP